MNEYMFGVTRCKPTREDAKKLDAIARQNGCYWVETTLPGDGYRAWFTGPNRGFPFDRDLANDVFQQIADAGINFRK